MKREKPYEKLIRNSANQFAITFPFVSYKHTF